MAGLIGDGWALDSQQRGGFLGLLMSAGLPGGGRVGEAADW